MSNITERTSIAAAGPDRGENTGSRDRVVAAYVVVSLLLLVPGLLAVAGLGLDPATWPGAWLEALDREMQDIAFGRTTRFWMGVVGASMMGVLLLYPLRKLFGIGRSISVGTSFHVHAVLGLLGPVLILYHCYFGTGSTPANVALFTTLAVAVSGIFGHFIYTRLSASFHGERKHAQDHLQDAKTALARLSASRGRLNLVEDLDTFEKQNAAERRSVLAVLGWAPGLGESRSAFTSRARLLVEAQGPADGWSPAKCADQAGLVQSALDAYFTGLARSARRSGWERLAGYWRMLHLPLFYITVIATLVHVYKVWDMDGPPPAVLEAAAEPGDTAAEADVAGRSARDARVAGAGTSTPDSLSSVAEAVARHSATRPPPFATRSVTTLTEAPVGISPAADAAPPPAPPAKVASAPAKAASPPQASAPPKANAPKAAEPKLIEPPKLVQVPQLAVKPAAPARNAATLDEQRMALGAAGSPGGPGGGDATPPPPRDGEPALAALAPVGGELSPQAEPVRPAAAKAAAPLVVAKASQPAPRTAAAEAKPQAAGPDPVAELARKTAQLDNTGRLDPAAMKERLATLKKDPTFNHDKTRFPLTGKHKRVTCESCHKTTLKDTPSRCIDCHKKDDVHRGRRPNCESCHVTTNWGTIKRR